MSESSLQVIKLPLEVYHHFELGIEQDERCTASLIKQETEWLHDDKGFMTGGKVQQYPNFVRFFHTSEKCGTTPVSTKVRNSGFQGQGWTRLPFC